MNEDKAHGPMLLQSRVHWNVLAVAWRSHAQISNINTSPTAKTLQKSRCVYQCKESPADCKGMFIGWD